MSALSGCSNAQKVGSDSLKNFKQQTNQPRLGERSPTAKPTVLKTAQPRVTQAPPPVKTQTQRPVPPRQTQAPALKLEIDINGDNTASTQFNPAAAALYQGTIVTWVNKDTKSRGVASSDGKTFKSPPIPPGKSWSWTANVVGHIDYSDSTRPYAVGSLDIHRRG